jgi:hypothetical protein
MFPIIRPGSVVQIDQNQRKVLQEKWEDEDPPGAPVQANEGNVQDNFATPDPRK